MRALLLTLLTTLLVQGGNLASGMLAAHFLGAQGRGELAAAQLWPTAMAYFLLFGLNDATLYFTASKRHPADQTFAVSFWSGLLASGLAVAVTVLLVVPLAYQDQAPGVGQLAVWLCAIIPLHIIGMIGQEALRGHGLMGLWNMQRVFLAAGYPLAILAASGLGYRSIEGLGMAYVAAHVLPCLVPLTVLLRRGWMAVAAPRPVIRDVLAYGLRIHVSGLINQINSRLDQMLIAHLLEPRLLGLYVVATSLAQVPATLANSVAMVAFPRACAAVEGDARRVLVGLYFRLTLLLVCAGSLVLGLAAPIFLRVMFGPDFVEAADITRILLVGGVLVTAREFLFLAFKAFDRMASLSASEALVLGVNAGVLMLAVPQYGLFGAALAYCAVRLVQVVFLAVMARRQLALGVRDLLLPTAADKAALLHIGSVLRGRLAR
jgi:O-antigen/teichoic acid export membrane protein